MCLHRLWERSIGYEPKILSSIYLNNSNDNETFIAPTQVAQNALQ